MSHNKPRHKTTNNTNKGSTMKLFKTLILLTVLIQASMTITNASNDKNDEITMNILKVSANQ